MTVSETSLILVCLLPSPRDLEIARLLGWYRIPLRTAPKVVAVDYLAFYQPSAFGGRGGQIEFVAKSYGALCASVRRTSNSTKLTCPKRTSLQRYCWPSWELRNWIAIMGNGEKLI